MECSRDIREHQFNWILATTNKSKYKKKNQTKALLSPYDLSLNTSWLT